MKILVLGAGGVGGYFGGRLAEAGVDVTFLVRPKRREQIEREGLVIESPLGDARILAKTVVLGEPLDGFDLVVLTCKAYDLDSSIEAIAPAMVGDTALLPLLNGVAHFGILDARFGAERVIGGTCRINAVLTKDGVVRHLEPLNQLVFGERDGSKSSRTRALSEVLAKTSIDFTWSDDIEQDIWEKLVFLSALASVTCLFRGNMSEVLAAPDGKAFALRALEANVAIATKEGHAPRPAMLDWIVTRLTTPGPQSASMLRDMESGHRVESDPIVGYMRVLANEHGVDDTVLALAQTHLKTYEARRAAGRLGP